MLVFTGTSPRVSTSSRKKGVSQTIFQNNIRLSRRTSETPTATASLEKVLQYASDLYCSIFGVPEPCRKGNSLITPPICIAVRLPFVSQHAPHLYCHACGEVLIIGVARANDKQYSANATMEVVAEGSSCNRCKRLRKPCNRPPCHFSSWSPWRP